MTGQEHRPFSGPSSGGSWITQADRAEWQRRAAGELLKILAGCAELPAIAWMITPGGHLTGHVGTQADPDGGRAAFTAWRVALRMGEVQEAAAGDGARAYLRASASLDGVRVTITATVVDLPGTGGTGSIPLPHPPAQPDAVGHGRLSRWRLDWTYDSAGAVAAARRRAR